jgi:ankyrin repeat protein
MSDLPSDLIKQIVGLIGQRLVLKNTGDNRLSLFAASMKATHGIPIALKRVVDASMWHREQHEAAATKIKVFELLLESCKTHECYQAVFLNTIKNQSIDLARIMLEKGLLEKGLLEKGLVLAAGNGDLTTVRMLLDWPENAPRADCRNSSALVAAARGGRDKTVRMLLERPENAPRADCCNSSALVAAARGGHYETVRMLLEWPENTPRADCLDALLAAAMKGRVQIVKMLLEWPENAPTLAQRCEALVYAAHYGHYLVARLLLEGISVIRLECASALVAAATNGHTQVVCLIMREMPEIHKNWSCQKALVVAAENGHTQIVRMLLEAKLDYKGYNTGHDALFWAKKNGHEKIVCLLLKMPDITDDIFGENRLQNAYAALNALYSVSVLQQPT